MYRSSLISLNARFACIDVSNAFKCFLMATFRCVRVSTAELQARCMVWGHVSSTMHSSSIYKKVIEKFSKDEEIYGTHWKRNVSSLQSLSNSACCCHKKHCHSTTNVRCLLPLKHDDNRTWATRGICSSAVLDMSPCPYVTPLIAKREFPSSHFFYCTL